MGFFVHVVAAIVSIMFLITNLKVPYLFRLLTCIHVNKVSIFPLLNLNIPIVAVVFKLVVC